MTAQEKLSAKVKAGKHVCVGLDSDIKKIPGHLNSVLEFNKRLIESTYNDAAAYKINFAFYESDGTKGYENLEKTISFIPEDVLIIGDAKRGDIGNTSEMYADSIYNYLKCDCATIAPYMGGDSIQPFLKNSGKINFILALTSNPGANDFEKLRLERGEFLFQRVISRVKELNVSNNCGIVFGATKLPELLENIDSFDDMPVLLPGVGAQGGSFSDVVTAFKGKNKLNYLINVSRGIIYKSSGEDFASAAQQELQRYNSEAEEIYNG